MKVKRQSLGDGAWFNVAAATRYKEEAWWNGQNHISKATGSQWDHEALYRTRTGRWVLHTWSQRQSSQESWNLVDDATATRWLIAHGHDPVDRELAAMLEV
jgi:hypothetical protein